MAFVTPQMAMGHYLRTQRKARGFNLQQLAARAKITVGYLSDIERGRRAPSSKVLQSLAPVLELDTQELLIRGGHIPDYIIDYIREHPSASLLLHRLVRYNLSDKSVAIIVNHIDTLVHTAQERKHSKPQDDNDEDDIEESDEFDQESN